MTRKAPANSVDPDAMHSIRRSDTTQSSAAVHRGGTRKATQRANQKIAAIFTEDPIVSTRKRPKETQSLAKSVSIEQSFEVGVRGAPKSKRNGTEPLLTAISSSQFPQHPSSAPPGTIMASELEFSDEDSEDLPSDQESLRKTEDAVRRQLGNVIRTCLRDKENIGTDLDIAMNNAEASWYAAVANIPEPIESLTVAELEERFGGSFERAAVELGVEPPGTTWGVRGGDREKPGFLDSMWAELPAWILSTEKLSGQADNITSARKTKPSARK
ncbi:hypothetical protein M427DRAFT_51712 [Gonapodya prolifera JEL478]|uniref:Uncharacterized protein n=1 Tax=Gonapodya prolifera (strain JEL478) TaxID=1344416 RepID=A0A139AW84_GONPJ|nr:hypothetical protein M427DRAFT_51712 [Gonapodya prolifera JEL478]|eukprot:KXS20735.1 hypothetical protein M427DRAFT_51712 [Gonapodya prolifera JEL478]